MAPLENDIALFARDIEEVLKVKAAFSLALEQLLSEASLPTSEVRCVYLAGALGQHASPTDLCGLGFLPPELGQRTEVVGNASLQGAIYLLTHPEFRVWVAEWAAGIRLVDLTAMPDFTTAYMRHMRFS